MRYTTFDSDNTKKYIIYCNLNGDETPEDIMKVTLYHYIDKFKTEEHQPVNCKKILNDTNIFIMENINTNGYELWQVCSKVSDMIGNIIPHAYYIRRIGCVFE